MIRHPEICKASNFTQSRNATAIAKQAGERRLLAAIRSIRKHDCTVTVDDSPVVDVEADPFGDGDPFAMTAKSHEVAGRVEMLHPINFLLNDRPGIEMRGDIMASGTDQFYPALVSLFVGIRANKGR